MPVPGKKLPTHKVEVLVGLAQPKHFLIPAEQAKGLLKLLGEYEIQKENSTWTAAEDVFPELRDPVERPASILRGARERENLSQIELSKRLGITQGDLSKMENGKRPIGKKMAQKLSKLLKIDYRVFL